MPLLGALLVQLVTALAAFFVKFLTRRVAIVAAALTALGTITTALLATFNGIVAPLVAQAFSTSFGQVIGLAFPPVAGTCMASLALCWGACTLFGWQRKAISISAAA